MTEQAPTSNTESTSPEASSWDTLTEYNPYDPSNAEPTPESDPYATLDTGDAPSADDPYALLDAGQSDDPYAALDADARHELSSEEIAKLLSDAAAEQAAFEAAEREKNPELTTVEIAGLCDIALQEMDAKKDAQGLLGNELGDARALQLMRRLFAEGDAKPQGYREDDDPATFLKRTITELQGRVSYSAPDKPIAFEGYDGANYYAARRALHILDTFAKDPASARSIVLNARGEATLNPAVETELFNDMYYLNRAELSALK